MTSQNFEFIRPDWEALATLGGFAERYVHTDPSSALVKLRSFGEVLVDYLYDHHRLAPPPQSGQFEQLTDAMFESAVPRAVRDKLHCLRKQGNRAAHGHAMQAATSTWMLKEAFELSKWLFVRYGNGNITDLAALEMPPRPDDDALASMQHTSSTLRHEITRQESALAQLLQQLEDARAETSVTQATAAELEHALSQSQEVVNTLEFSEAETRRRLIDVQLAETGWDIAANGDQTNEVTQEEEVPDQPTDSGLGYADYVLWADDGRPLAVIEAKKTAVNPQLGQEQAKLYADGLENKTGHRPVIFYTNGYDIWMWNDHHTVQEPPRELYGFYSKDSLEYLIHQRVARKPVTAITPKPEIAGRLYQIEAIKRITERFAAKHRSALCVQATGTGKTRVAVSLCEAMIQANWARRILFLCDRRELRKQANGVFKEFLGQEPRVNVNRSTYKQREHSIYMATYPAMRKIFESFDVGFFDLIIADESHRSIFNRYKEIFEYFDARKVGLTATPVKFIHRNTYSFFGCDDRDPTSYFSYEDAVNNNPPYLVPFQAKSISFEFTREGISYTDMTAEQRAQLEEQESVPEDIEYSQANVDKQIFNKDTNRRILRNLMENGICIKDGTQLGKSIIFARNHNHAVLLHNIFNELYPQFGGKMCRVIDTYDPRAEDLIDQFKNPDDPLTIAISVDMLDTGIDVPEVVNLVFAKAIFSIVKFWQMIGRGTRLCPDLLGLGQDKTHFMIFDHWKNFDYFDLKQQEADNPPAKSLLQKLFEARVELAQTALNKPDLDSFKLAIDLLHQDVIDLPDKTIAVRDLWREVQTARQRETLEQFAPQTVTMLQGDIAPLMKWRNPEGHQPAYSFDHLIAMIQNNVLTGGSRLADHRDTMLNQIAQLQMSLSQVKAKAETIASVKSPEFWDSPTVSDLEEVRTQLRGIMRFRIIDRPDAIPPKVIDVTEEESLIEQRDVSPRLDGLQEAAYRQRVDKALHAIMDDSPALQAIRRGERITEEDLQSISSLVLAQDADLSLEDLKDYYPQATRLDLVIRSIVGLDSQAVEQHFKEFVQRHAGITATQTTFLRLLQNHIAKYGTIKIEQLYDAPFTTLDADGLDGVFPIEDQVDELLAIIQAFDITSGPDKDRTDS